MNRKERRALQFHPFATNRILHQPNLFSHMYNPMFIQGQIERAWEADCDYAYEYDGLFYYKWDGVRISYDELT